MINLKDGKDRNEISCLAQELLEYVGFINNKEPTVYYELFITSSVRDNVTDDQLFWTILWFLILWDRAQDAWKNYGKISPNFKKLWSPYRIVDFEKDKWKKRQVNNSHWIFFIIIVNLKRNIKNFDLQSFCWQCLLIRQLTRKEQAAVFINYQTRDQKQVDLQVLYQIFQTMVHVSNIFLFHGGYFSFLEILPKFGLNCGINTMFWYKFNSKVNFMRVWP